MTSDGLNATQEFKALMAAVPGVVSVRGDAPVGRVCEDSRLVRRGDLFVARKGSKISGAEFAAAAISAGAVAVVSEEEIATPANVAFARVRNSNLALAVLAQAAAFWPAKNLKLLGVTGTKGKTTVAYLVRSMLKAAGHGCGMIGTVEIDDGQTLTPAEMTTPGAVELAGLLRRIADNGAKHCVMEVSSHALHQDRTGGLEFAVGMFTNLTGDHLDYHGTMENYAAAKARLFEGLSRVAVAVVNQDDAWVERMVQGCAGRVVRYGLEDGRPRSTAVQWRARILDTSASGMRLEVHAPGERRFTLETPLVGKHNAYNLLCAMAGVDAVGVDVKAMVRGLEGNVGAPGRLQPVYGDGLSPIPYQVFVDYAHTHDALENVLSTLRPLTKRKLICVFGCGGDRDRTKRPKMAAAAERLADHVIVTSDNPRTEEPGAIIEEILKGFSVAGRKRVTVEADRRAAIRLAIGAAGEGDVVLIAGKGHENYQIIGTTKAHFDDVEEATAAMG